MRLYDPLVTLQKQVAGLLGHADRASQVLLCLATAARKSGRLPVAMNALHELQITLRYASTSAHQKQQKIMIDKKLLKPIF